ncbi:helix-turn-helix domain-containing protein [Actinoplanes sp. NPDC049118]|uniref:PucR family transcriptional regulator n=1 Tax=Actinoplanes sp. NPDC049118 TaxID=3155769 RepID=UPI0033EBEBAC
MSARMPQLTRTLHARLAVSIKELRGDRQILELLATGIESNLETLGHVLRFDISIDEVTPPAAALEYARRLAQHGVSPQALARAFRLAQELVLDWAFNETIRREPDPRVALAASRLFVRTTFRFVDVLLEQLIIEYESERVRWLDNRNHVRTAMANELLAGASVDIASAETALAYRLGRRHLGVVLWTNEHTPPAAGFQGLEPLLVRMSESVGASGHPLYVPNDGSTGWGWIPLGHLAQPPDLSRLPSLLERTGRHVYAALGTPACGISGFRATHIEADRTRQIMMHSPDRAPRLTSFTDPGVRAAAMLSLDLEAARRLVETALGPLSTDTAQAARLRDTLLTFLAERCSYTATAERVNLHKSTVRYRVEKAIATRGRPIHDERLDLELALVACRWLGSQVLKTKTSG